MSAADMYPQVGIVGAGSFGLAIAGLIAPNTNVLMFSRQQEVVNQINKEHKLLGHSIAPNIKATNDLEQLANDCRLLFPVVPSANFRDMMQSLGPYLKPSHLMIHATKGLDVPEEVEKTMDEKGLGRDQVSTMSEVIRQESAVVRIGAFSGPNLAAEIIEGQPTATVVASKFREVIEAGKAVLSSGAFHVFGSRDVIGAELAGALKNTIALGSGILAGRGYGKNIEAMLITRGWVEMVHFGGAIGTSKEAFFGTAGIGDLVATATSSKSRNFTFGYRLGQGETFEEVLSSQNELAEGVRTLRITRYLAKSLHLRVPITEMLYQVVFDAYPVERALEFLMRYPYDVDVDFL